MSTAVARKTTYNLYSRGRENRIIRQPLDDRDMMDGRKVRVSERIHYDFAPHGRLTIVDGQDILADGPPDAEGQPTEQDAITWLKSGYRYSDGHYGPHPYFNERIWIEGEEPDRPRPLETDFNKQVNAALAQLDPAPVEALLEQERATHNRPVLVANAEDALSTILAMKAAEAESA